MSMNCADIVADKLWYPSYEWAGIWNMVWFLVPGLVEAPAGVRAAALARAEPYPASAPVASAVVRVTEWIAGWPQWHEAATIGCWGGCAPSVSAELAANGMRVPLSHIDDVVDTELKGEKRRRITNRDTPVIR